MPAPRNQQTTRRTRRREWSEALDTTLQGLAVGWVIAFAVLMTIARFA